MFAFLLLFFFITILLVVFSKNGFINDELRIYYEKLRHPWVNRLVLALYKQ